MALRRVPGNGATTDAYRRLTTALGIDGTTGEIVDATLSVQAAGATLAYREPGSPKPADTDPGEAWPASSLKFWGPRAAKGSSFLIEGYWIRSTALGVPATLVMASNLDTEA